MISDIYTYVYQKGLAPEQKAAQTTSDANTSGKKAISGEPI
jgi:hypothetical protein